MDINKKGEVRQMFLPFFSDNKKDFLTNLGLDRIFKGFLNQFILDNTNFQMYILHKSNIYHIMFDISTEYI